MHHIGSLKCACTGSKTGAFYVPVARSPVIQQARENLPVVMEEDRIMDTIQANDVIIICGETGSGKTTQVPQFLYEAGYGRVEAGHPGAIAITQPRRVAAIRSLFFICPLPPPPHVYLCVCV